jgi:hypothetical protein
MASIRPEQVPMVRLTEHPPMCVVDIATGWVSATPCDVSEK